MPLTQNDEGISKNSNMTLFLGSAIFIANLIFYGVPVYLTMSDGLTREAYSSYMAFKHKLVFFETPIITLATAAVFIAIFIWSNRRKKTTEYIPPKMMLPIINLLVSLGQIERFEWEEKSDRNGIMRKWKKRERVEGQAALAVGVFLLFFSILPITLTPPFSSIYPLCYFLYAVISVTGFLYFILGGNYIHAMQKDFGTDDNDANNDLQESFKQCEVYLANKHSVNLPTEFKYEGKIRHGWINVVNPFRATQVLGTPGSGKSYAVINEFIRQHLAKHFTMYCYDFKFPDLSLIVYNHMLWHKEEFRMKHGREPKFCVINFDDPRKSLRCNPIEADSLQDITYAYDTAYTIMLNLNKSWAQKQGDFFVESPINYLTSCIWYLKNVEGGKFCSLPHVVEFVNRQYVDCIPIMSTIPELANYMSAFFEAWEGGAQDQLQGQIASVRIPLARISSPELYWVMSGNDFSLDLNNPEDPKVLCVGNNPEKKDINATALGLYNSRIVKMINKKDQHPITLIIDELPTIFFRGLDNLIATARSNKVAVVLGFQDYSQIKRDYGDKEATAIINTIGNTFSGLVTGETAQTLEKQFGRNKQKRKSVSYSDSGESYSISEQNDTLIPASKISTLTQGTFVGTVSDDFGQEIEEKRFHARICIENELVREQGKRFHPLPTLYSFDNVKVARELCKKITAFLRDKDNYVANCLLSKAGLATLTDFQCIDLASIKPSDVAGIVGKLFTDENEPKKLMIVDYFEKLAKGYLKVLMAHESELQAASNSLLNAVRKGTFSTDTVNQFSNTCSKSLVTLKNEMAEWISTENDNKHDSETPTIIHSIVVYRDFLESLDKIDEVRLPDKISEENHKHISVIRGILNKYVTLKASLQLIRDEEMHEILNRNAEQIRKDIDDLIDDQLVALYRSKNPQHHDMWVRRINAAKRDEKQELVRLGLADEVKQREELLKAQEAAKNKQ